MSKKDRYKDDINEEFNITLEDNESDEDINDVILQRELQNLSELIIKKLGVEIEPEIIEELVEAYSIDITNLDEAVNPVYNVYAKEFKS